MSGGTFSDDEPGTQPLTKFAFEDWAPPEQQHTAQVLADHTTTEGRLLRPGDLITPTQALAERRRGLRVRIL